MDERYAYWLAALVDGEGSITIRDRGKVSGRKTLAVVIANNHHGLLEVAQERAAAGRIYESLRAYQLRIERTADILRVLTEIQPFLIVKRARALEALDVLCQQGDWVSPRVAGRFAAVVA